MIDGEWYEMPHNVGAGVEGKWMPKLNWCKEKFVIDDWEFRPPIYHYSEEPNGPTKKILATTPATWRFKNEQDYVLFLLRWV